MKHNKPILQMNHLSLHFESYTGNVHAIRGVSFNLQRGETFAIVGESGSGKTVTARAIMGLLSDTAVIDSGEIILDDENLLTKTEGEMQSIRGTKVAMIFQDPMTSLNPTLTIGQQIAEVLMKKRDMSKSEAVDYSINLLQQVGIHQPEKRFKQYPHQFSGGQRQRIVIAIALAGDPDILIADEPTTALDVTIQAQILELLNQLKEERQMTIIFITHDLGVVANMADRVAVMYAGKIVEIGTTDDIFYNPQHPYTWGLLSALPSVGQDEELYAIPGTPPDLREPPKGDAFAPRNEYALAIDYEKEPPMFQVNSDHYAATWLLHPAASSVQPPDMIQKRWEYFKSKDKATERKGLAHG